MTKYQRAALYVLIISFTGIYVYLKRQAFLQVLAVFVYAGVFAAALTPLQHRLERMGIGAHLSAFISVMAFVFVMALLVSTFIPYLVTHSIRLIMQITPTLTTLFRQVGDLLSQVGLRLEQQSRLTEMAASAVSRLMGVLARWGIGFAAQTGRIAFSLVITYYLLCERRKTANHMLLIIPSRHRMSVLHALVGCKNALLSYLSGMAKTSGFVFLATFLGLRLLGVQDALLLSVFMGVLEILPYIGPVLASIPILLLTLPMGLYQTLLALGLVVLVQQLEGNIVSPYFTASSTSLHPLTALISVFLFGSLLGIWGILLSVPAVILVRSVAWSLHQREPALGRRSL